MPSAIRGVRFRSRRLVLLPRPECDAQAAPALFPIGAQSSRRVRRRTLFPSRNQGCAQDSRVPTGPRALPCPTMSGCVRFRLLLGSETPSIPMPSFARQDVRIINRTDQPECCIQGPSWSRPREGEVPTGTVAVTNWACREAQRKETMVRLPPD